MENRYRMLTDDKARGEHENRLKLDRAVDEIQASRHALEELKYQLAEKCKQNCDLSDELNRAKRVLDEKYFEAGRLRDESVAKGDQVGELKRHKGALEHEIETVKANRAEMWREVGKFKEMLEQKTLDAQNLQEQQKSLNHELLRATSRIDDVTKLIDLRSHDLRAKQMALEETERELHRISAHNMKAQSENEHLKRDNDRVVKECFTLKRDLGSQEQRSGDCSL